MRIAYVVINANRREGTSRAVLEVAERLAANHDVDLVARTLDDVDLTKLKWQKIRGPGWPEVGDFGSFVVLADRFLRGKQYDIIHSAGPNCTTADVYTIQTVHAVKRRVMQNIAADSLASLPRRFTRRLYDRAVLAAESRAYRSINPRGRIAYLPVSEGTEAELLSEYPVSAGLLRVVPNGADLDRFHPTNREEHRSAIRRQFGLSDDDFVVVFSGGDWIRKGLPLLVEAIGQVSTANVKLLVLGTDPLENELKHSFAMHGMQHRLVFAGFQNDVHRFYAAGDVFAFPSSYEAFSLATIEAAASGLPVLMTNVSGAQELVGSGEAGLLVERDAKAFARAIESLASDLSSLQRLATSARRFVEQNFSWDQIARSTEATYEELLNVRRRANSSAELSFIAMS